MQDRAGRWLLLLGTLGFAVLGQLYFARKPDYFWDGVLFYAVAVFCFLLLVRRPRAKTPIQADRRSGWSAASIARSVLMLAAVLLGALAVIQSARLNAILAGGGSAWPTFWTWISAMVLYLAAFACLPRIALGRRSDRAVSIEGQQLQDRSHSAVRSLSVESARDWLAAHGWEVGLLLLLLFGALVVRAWRLDTIPWTLGGDEGSQGLWARDVIEGRLPNMFGLGWLSVPNMSFYWQAAWFRLFGDNIVGLRLPWAVVGVLTVLGTYLLVRRLFDRGLAFLTAFLLATYHFHIHYSRLGSNQIADPFFTVWALYFLVVGMQSTGGEPGNDRRPAHWAWAATGIICGLGFYFYAGSRQSLLIVAAVLAWAAVADHGLLGLQIQGLWAMIGGFLVAAGPMVLLALRDPANFNARINQVGIFQSKWLENEVQKTGRSAARLLAQQLRQALFAFNLAKDRVVWYGPRTIPLMDFSASILFLLGLAASVSRLLKWRYAVFVIWFAVVIVVGGALTENPPSSQRIVSSAVPAVFFVAVALRELTAVLRDLLGLSEFSRHTAAAGLAVVLAVISLRFYFGPYQQSWVYGSFNGEVATRLGYYLHDLGPEWQEYFFGAPRMYADFGSTPFIAKGVKLYDVMQPLSGSPDFVDPSRKAVFVFLPERLNELAFVQEAYPNGVLDRVHRTGAPDGPLLFVSYMVGN